MATKTTVQLLDDMTGDAADETVTFAIDGTEYAIDLSANNAGVLRDILGDYIKAGRKAGKLGTYSYKARATSGGVRRSREHLAAVRAWLRQQGETVNDRGRIAADLMAKFDAAHAGLSQTPAHEPHRTWA